MRTIILTLALAVILSATPALAQQPPLFLANQDFAPYSMMTNGRPSGIDVEVLTEAGRRANIPFNIQLKPWNQVVSMFENGDCEAVVAMFRTKEREKHGMFMEGIPIHTSDYVLFTKVGSKLTFDTYADLSGKIIGRVAGTDLGKDFAKAEMDEAMDVKDYPDMAAALMGLINGEIDGYAGNIDVTYNRLKNMGMTSSIVYLPKKVLTDKPAYLVFARASNYPEKQVVLQKLERALDGMMKDGTYNKIARRYLLRF
jgi:polar amino acid transport system substrate-binding protein